MLSASIAPTAQPQVAQCMIATLKLDVSGVTVVDANRVPSHFGHLGGDNFITCKNLRPNDQGEPRRTKGKGKP